MIYDGWGDYNNPRHWMNYYAKAQKTFGSGKVASSMRLYLMPGVDPCRGGAGCDTFDRLEPLKQWVENGKAPARFLASHLTQGKVTLTRPLCPYPQMAKYKGTGSTDEAENFVCTEPKPAAKQ